MRVRCENDTASRVRRFLLKRTRKHDTSIVPYDYNLLVVQKVRAVFLHFGINKNINQIRYSTLINYVLLLMEK